jgi:hypothetical protein
LIARDFAEIVVANDCLKDPRFTNALAAATNVAFPSLQAIADVAVLFNCLRITVLKGEYARTCTPAVLELFSAMMGAAEAHKLVDDTVLRLLHQGRGGFVHDSDFTIWSRDSERVVLDYYPSSRILYTMSYKGTPRGVRGSPLAYFEGVFQELENFGARDGLATIEEFIMQARKAGNEES